MYDVSFMKVKELITCGDIEVNPGPVNNNVETPKGKGGRPKKTGFKGFPKKLNFSQLDTDTKSKKIGFKGTPKKCEIPKKTEEIGSPANVLCAHCENIITITESNKTSVKCTHCDYRSLVSHLKPVEHNVIDESLLKENSDHEIMNKKADVDKIVVLDGLTENTPKNNHFKGRHRESKGFNGTPSKKQRTCEDQDIDLSIEIARDTSHPLGLINRPGQNVCFFNSIMQVLFSIESFREYVYHLNTNDPAVVCIKNLFTEIESSRYSVETSL